MLRHSLRKIKLGPMVKEWVVSLRHGTPHPFEPTPLSQQEREEFFLTHKIPPKVRTEFDLCSEHSFTDSGEEEDEGPGIRGISDPLKDEGIDADQDYLDDFDGPGLELEDRHLNPNIFIQPPLGAMSTVYFYPHDLSKFVILEEEAESERDIEDEFQSNKEGSNEKLKASRSESESSKEEFEGPVYLSDLKDFMQDIAITKENWNCIVVYNMPRHYSYLDSFGKLGKLLHAEPGVGDDCGNYVFLWYSSIHEAEWVSKMMNNKRVQDTATKKWKNLRCWRLFDFEEEEDKKEYEGFTL